MPPPAGYSYAPKAGSPDFFVYTDDLIEAAWSIRGGPVTAVGTWISKPMLGLPWGPQDTSDF